LSDAISAVRSAGDLFRLVQLGPYELANRIVTAPLTSSRANLGGMAGPLTAEYYARRAITGLIIAEGANNSPQARGSMFWQFWYVGDKPLFSIRAPINRDRLKGRAALVRSGLSGEAQLRTDPNAIWPARLQPSRRRPVSPVVSQ
jgi:hypothetical protein